MKCVIVGGDGRFDCLERMLEADGEKVLRIKDKKRTAESIQALREAECIIMNYPIRSETDIDFAKVMRLASERAVIYLCGPAGYDSADARVIDLWKDEQLIAENAVLTAEGAVASAMQAGAKALRECSCLVIGWGRIGRALTEILVGMGAKVTVASRSLSGRNRAIERGAFAVDTDHLRLKGFHVIFSTPPAMVLDEARLKKADRDAMIIDLASPPYGVDLKTAWDQGLRAWREPGLPGRYCPESAALAILRAIDRAKGR